MHEGLQISRLRVRKVGGGASYGRYRGMRGGGSRPYRLCLGTRRRPHSTGRVAPGRPGWPTRGPSSASCSTLRPRSARPNPLSPSKPCCNLFPILPLPPPPGPPTSQDWYVGLDPNDPFDHSHPDVGDSDGGRGVSGVGVGGAECEGV